MSDPDNRDPHSRNRSLLDIYRAQESRARAADGRQELSTPVHPADAPSARSQPAIPETGDDREADRKPLSRRVGDNPLIAALSRRLRNASASEKDAFPEEAGQSHRASGGSAGMRTSPSSSGLSRGSASAGGVSISRNRQSRTFPATGHRTADPRDKPEDDGVGPAATSYATAEPAADADLYWRPLIDPAAVIMGIVRSKWLIVALTLVGAVLGVLIALATPKDFYASTQLLFDPRDIQIIEHDLTRGGLPSDATLALIENQVSVIGSGSVLSEVVERLDLADDPEFNGQGEASILDTLSNPRSLLSWSDEKADAATRATLAIDHLAESLNVGRNEKTFIIDIGVTTREAEKSARIANTVAAVFIETYGEMQSRIATRANDEITSRLDELRSSVETSERAVADFKSKHDIVDAQGRLISEESILKLNDQLSGARARTAELRARAGSAGAVDAGTVLSGALPEQVASSALAELRAQYASLKQQADRLANRLGPRHPERLALQAQLAGLRQQISDELKRVVASLQVDLNRAEKTEQALASRLAEAKAHKARLADEQVQLNELQREAESRRAVYETFLQRARETGQQRGLNTGNVNIISKAFPPLRADGPSRAMIAIVATILGFLAGIAIGAARGAVRSFRDNASRSRPSGPALRPVVASAPTVVPVATDDASTDLAAGPPDDHRARLRSALDAPVREEMPAPSAAGPRPARAARPEDDGGRTRAEIDALRRELRGFRREVDALMAMRDARRAG